MPGETVGAFTESVVEEAALAWLEGLGYTILHGPDIAADMPGAERSDPGYRDVVLEGVFEQRRFLDLIRYFIVIEHFGRFRPAPCATRCPMPRSLASPAPPSRSRRQQARRLRRVHQRLRHPAKSQRARTWGRSGGQRRQRDAIVSAKRCGGRTLKDRAYTTRRGGKNG
jgi:hypothetical protein